MSTKRENNVTDSDPKKCMDVEESKDSGFISAEIELSGEVDTSDIDQDYTNSNPSSQKSFNIPPRSADDKYMRSDSGIAHMSGQFSELSIGSDGQKLNNLSGSQTRSCSYSSSNCQSNLSSKQEDAKQMNSLEVVTEVPVLSDSPWEYYFHQDEDGDTPLHLGIIHGFTEAIHSLIRLAPYPHLLDLRNDHCQSPLHLAVLTGQSFVVRLLILAGARQSTRDRYGETALHIACHKGDLLCVRALTAPVSVSDVERLGLKYGDIHHEAINYEQWNYEGETCVHVAAMRGHTEIVRHLVWLKADINAREGKAGYTALHYAVARKDKAMLELLLNECKEINLETPCYSRLTAYEITRDPEVRNMLVSKGAIPNETESDESSYSSDEEDSDSENKMSYSTTHYTKSTAVPINASA